MQLPSRRRHWVTLGLLTAALAQTACGSDGGTEPEPPYPAVSGTYTIQATFDDFAPSIANGSGTITFTQADRNLPGLTATGSFTAVVAADASTSNGFRNVTVTTSGAISFQLNTTSTTAAWGFDGTLSQDGRTITGRHTLVGSTSSFSGDWTATKPQ